MKLVLYSINHRNCPVGLREHVSFDDRRQRDTLERLRGESDISEAVILQTCNRLEFYLYARKSFDTAGFLVKLIDRANPDSAEIWRTYSTETTGTDVVKHLFEVAAGLDSQMIGENQILSQVKSAYAMSLDCRMSKLLFHRLFHNAFRVGKAVRTETNINCGAVSVGLAAVELARTKIELPCSTAMIIGAGENAQLIARYLVKAGAGKLIIANRDPQKARNLCAALKCGSAAGLDDLPAALDKVDLIIASTAAAEPVLTLKVAEKTLAERDRKLLIIDIAVPRDIDEQIGQFDCVSLYNIDDLNEHISFNKEKRENEIPKARKIVDDFTAGFVRWYESLDIVPVISELTKKTVDLARLEARRYAGDFGPDNRDKLELFAESLAKKLLHGPISFIKAGSDEEPASSDQLQALDLINKMFLLQDKSSRK